MKVRYVISDVSFPPREGLHQQTLLLVSALSSHGIELEVIGFARSMGQTQVESAERQTGVPMLIASVPRGMPQLALAILNRTGLSRWCLGPEVGRIVRRLHAPDVDLIHFDGLAASCLYRGRRSKCKPSVLSLIDPGSRRQRRFARHASSTRHKFLHILLAIVHWVLEQSLRHPLTVWHVVSKSDAIWLRKHRRHPTIAIPVINPPANSSPSGRPLAEVPGLQVQRTVVIFADLRTDHLASAFRDLFRDDLAPRANSFKHCHFKVLGRVSEVTGLEVADAKLSVEYLPWVDDYIAVLQHADAIILPDTVGTGIKNRAIQALAAGTPVIGTAVSFEGIPVQHGRDALISTRDQARTTGALLEALVSPRGFPASIGEAGATLAQRLYSPSAVSESWSTLYRDLSTRAQGNSI